ncbi:D-alanine--poly(phosphoribitol) ligase subunit 2 [Anaerotignum neopropionicum]|uniref:D-alanine--poly(Phosphoribitol) ligase subunit 2 n=1 Tax=Anaerotignum neopropionicum TaxID=36847 RepID=A0A136WFV3_9FIRM|nr:acyl carrier protein [Anaerotignum neopropionicum]KXL53428.1 D-alanine--poly(phosphoribitol) ligase subunit 2 [Anaerotignum neopropionicum]
METLLKILAELRPDVDFEENKELVDSGELDSFDIVSLVGELCEAYEIQIGAEDIIPENFNSVEAIMALVKRLQED